LRLRRKNAFLRIRSGTREVTREVTRAEQWIAVVEKAAAARAGGYGEANGFNEINGFRVQGVDLVRANG